MSRIVILEGPDGGGKSTLARDAFPDFLPVHLSAPKGDPLAELAEHVDRALSGGANVVFDRLHLSQQVYGPLYRGGGFRPVDFWRVEDWLRARNAVVVLCLPPKRVSAAVWASRRSQGGEMYAEGYDAVWDAYKAIQTTLPMLMHDYTWNNARSTRRVVDATQSWLTRGGASLQPLTEYLQRCS